MTKKVREVINLLEESGWSLVRIRGEVHTPRSKHIE